MNLQSVEGRAFSGKDKLFHCHYSSLSRYQLATELQLPYSDIRLLDVVRVPSSLSSLSSLSSFSRFPPGLFSPRAAPSDGAQSCSRNPSADSEEKVERLTASRGGLVAAFSSLSSLFSRSSPETKGQKREPSSSSARSGSRPRDDLFASHAWKENLKTREEEPLALPFLPAGLDALKLQHAKILVRRTAILVQIENIGAVVTPHKLVLLHPHPSVTSALLHQLTCGEASSLSTASLLECNPPREEQEEARAALASGDEAVSSASPQTLSSPPFPSWGLASPPRQMPFELRALEALFAVALGSLDALTKEYVDRVRLTIATLEQESTAVSRTSRNNASNVWSLATADATLFTLVHSPSLHQLMVIKNLLQDIEARLEAFRGCLSKLLSDDGDMADMYLTDRLVYTIPHAREDHADVELLLEGCLQQVDELQYDILTAKRCVIHHEELTKMHLDVCRNAYMQMNVKISLFSLTTSVAAVIAGIFGMNLPLFDSQAAPPHHEPLASSGHPVSSSRGEENAGKTIPSAVERQQATVEVATGSAVASSASPEQKQASLSSPDVPCSSRSRSCDEAGGSSAGKREETRVWSASSVASPSALPRLLSRPEHLLAAFFPSLLASSRSGFSTGFLSSLWERVAVEEWQEAVRARRQALSHWVVDHSFFLVSGFLILPTCACGFVFCNRLARIFALHGCSSELSVRRSQQRPASTSKLASFFARPKAETGALLSRKKALRRPLFIFPALFSFNRHAARNMPFPPSTEMPARTRSEGKRDGT
ncbi:UNVERIFIED_CONTAM: CorA family Mg2+ transporter protein [Hammondia hammondi]|eukprot:XP_008885557.1 CorA family Mg2+ transporter protein [Hammondia hammondi]